MGSARGQGWLRTLRRFSGVAVLLFAAVVVVAGARVHALALEVGDDDLCNTMAFTGATLPATPTSDPTDLADRHHACCDLALCLDASALPPGEPVLAHARRVLRDRAVPAVPSRPRLGTRRAGFRPRDPPAL